MGSYFLMCYLANIGRCIRISILNGSLEVLARRVRGRSSGCGLWFLLDRVARGITQAIFRDSESVIGREIEFRLFILFMVEFWWARGDLNPGPPPRQGGVLTRLDDGPLGPSGNSSYRGGVL